MNIKIRNQKTFNGEGHYLGRPSPLGNPFKISNRITREMSIQHYESWIVRKILQNDPLIITVLDNLFTYLVEHSEITLLCWCKPKSCHCDVIKKLLLNKYYHGEYIIIKETIK